MNIAAIIMVVQRLQGVANYLIKRFHLSDDIVDRILDIIKKDKNGLSKLAEKLGVKIEEAIRWARNNPFDAMMLLLDIVPALKDVYDFAFKALSDPEDKENQVELVPVDSINGREALDKLTKPLGYELSPVVELTNEGTDLSKFPCQSKPPKVVFNEKRVTPSDPIDTEVVDESGNITSSIIPDDDIDAEIVIEKDVSSANDDNGSTNVEVVNVNGECIVSYCGRARSTANRMQFRNSCELYDFAGATLGLNVLQLATLVKLIREEYNGK
jgi:hypothetical protein